MAVQRLAAGLHLFTATVGVDRPQPRSATAFLPAVTAAGAVRGRRSSHTVPSGMEIEFSFMLRQKTTIKTSRIFTFHDIEYLRIRGEWRARSVRGPWSSAPVVLSAVPLLLLLLLLLLRHLAAPELIFPRVGAAVGAPEVGMTRALLVQLGDGQPAPRTAPLLLGMGRTGGGHASRLSRGGVVEVCL